VTCAALFFACSRQSLLLPNAPFRHKGQLS
jgi:hypothetical protein